MRSVSSITRAITTRGAAPKTAPKAEATFHEADAMLTIEQKPVSFAAFWLSKRSP
jgi:hypothetical protein